MSTGCWPATIGSVSTSAWRPSTASCSCAAGRATSSEAISTFLRSRSVRRLASLAVVVVLPEPCRPTIMITAGGVTSRSSSAVSEPSVSTSASWTILTTICPGVTERSTSWPTAFSVTWSTKSRATGSATSASSKATRTSRIAARTSASLSAPRPRSRSNTLPSRSLNVSNIQISSAMLSDPYGVRNAKYAGGRNLVGRRAPVGAHIDVCRKRSRAQPRATESALTVLGSSVIAELRLSILRGERGRPMAWMREVFRTAEQTAS